MLATWDLVLHHLWDLGIMMEHKIFCLEVINKMMGMDKLMVLVALPLNRI